MKIDIPDESLMGIVIAMLQEDLRLIEGQSPSLQCDKKDQLYTLWALREVLDYYGASRRNESAL